jgi:hypothetical protein
MTDYTVIGKFRNKDQCQKLINRIRERGKSCYSFIDKPADPKNPTAHPEKQMKNFESVENFYTDEYFQEIFETDLEGLKNAKQVIVLLPAGNSVHIEAGIAYGLGKPLILIGEEEKPESLYLIFQKRYKTIEEFLEKEFGN